MGLGTDPSGDLGHRVQAPEAIVGHYTENSFKIHNNEMFMYFDTAYKQTRKPRQIEYIKLESGATSNVWPARRKQT